MSAHVECPECGGDGKHRVYRHLSCATCNGAKVISAALQEELFKLAIEDRDFRKRLSESANTSIHTAEVLGHQTDFAISTKREGDNYVVKVETVMHGMRFSDGVLHTFPPPRFPWSK